MTGEPAVVSGDSPKTISEVFGPAVSLGVANDFRAVIGRNLIRLRRYRKRSQQSVADEVGTSQPAIARIEAGEDNLTADTVRKVAVALNGRIKFEIQPAEWDFPSLPAWYVLLDMGLANSISWSGAVITSRRTDDAIQAVAGWHVGSFGSQLCLVQSQRSLERG